MQELRDEEPDKLKVMVTSVALGALAGLLLDAAKCNPPDSNDLEQRSSLVGPY
jgi:hypothetical protein